MERNPFRHATGVTPPPKGEASPASKKHKIKQRTRTKYALGGKGVLVPSGHRPGPTEAAAETRPLEKLYIILKIEIPLPRQFGALLPKSACVGGVRGWETEKTSQMKQASRVQQKFNSPKISLLPNESLPTPTPPFPQKIPPHAPPSQPRSDPGFFGPIWIRSGLLGVRNGLFWVDSRLSRAKTAPIWAPVPPPGEPLRPGRRAKTSPPSPRTQAHPLHRNSPKSHKI